MKKVIIRAKLPVSILREGKQFVVYTPVLDLSTCGNTHAQAKRRFVEALAVFFDELAAHGTLEAVLDEYGWRKVKTGWQPPTIISHELEQVAVTV